MPFTGILQKGDGSIIEFDSYPKLFRPFIGNGKKRPFHCGSSSTNSCDGINRDDISLMQIVSMTSGPDGSIYIGDYNLVRRVLPTDGRTYTILEFE